MHFDIFSQGKSFFHKLDPRVKILVFIPLVFVVALLRDIEAAASYLALAVIFIVVAGTDRKALGSRIFTLNIFILMLWLTLPFSMDGKALFIFNHMSYSAQGVVYTLIITFKANAILLFTIALIGTTDVFALAHALFHLKFPKKLVYLAIFLYRYISVLHDEYDRLIKTAKARCFVPKTDIRTFKTYAYMVGMLFVNSYERSQRIYQALLLRGFRSDFPMLRHFHLHNEDIIFAGIMVLILSSGVILWN